MRTVLFAGVAFAFAASAVAQQTTQQQTQPRSETQPQAQQQKARTPLVASSGSEDIEFVFDAAKGGMTEVEMGKLAAEHAKNDEVKKFAQRMVDDHSKAGDQLKSIAESKGIRLPQEIEAKDRAMINRLSKLNGAAFDRAYMQQMVADHVKDVNEFKKEASSGRDSQVKSFASTTLPTLEEHLQQAKQARQAATATTAAN
jgi:putative membrane protein